MLKSGTVQFCPPLPPFKQEAIDNLEMGTENRIAMIFPQVIQQFFPPLIFETDLIIRVITPLGRIPCSFRIFCCHPVNVRRQLANDVGDDDSHYLARVQWLLPCKMEDAKMLNVSSCPVFLPARMCTIACAC